MESVKQSQQDWDAQFASGSWDFLTVHEAPRYGVIHSYIKSLRRPISLLDVGCGECAILHYSSGDCIERYCGIDISEEALNRVSCIMPNVKLICSTLENFQTQDRFDVILFNEVLYYVYDPDKSLLRFKEFLKPEGVFIISMYRKGIWYSYNRRCIRSVWKIMKDWNVIDEVLLTNAKSGVIWKLGMVRPYK